jgi:hypothetical protein
MGVLSTVLLSAGVLRHYYDVYVYRTVRGISFIFVGIDAAGDVFSLVSICTYIDTSIFPLIKLCQSRPDWKSLPSLPRYSWHSNLCNRICPLVRHLCVWRILQSWPLVAPKDKPEVNMEATNSQELGTTASSN